MAAQFLSRLAHDWWLPVLAWRPHKLSAPLDVASNARPASAGLIKALTKGIWSVVVYEVMTDQLVSVHLV